MLIASHRNLFGVRDGDGEMGRVILILSAVCFVLCLFFPRRSGADNYIVNGNSCTDSEFPYSVSLISSDANSSDAQSAHFCGGSLIASRYVLTAAHCVYNSSPSEIDAIIGRTNLSEKGGVRIGIDGIIVHPDYHPKPGHLENDIALMKLSSSADSPVVAIVTSTEPELTASGTTATIIGWGTIDPDIPIAADALQKAEIPIQDPEKCSAAFGSLYTKRMLCAGVLSNGNEKWSGVSPCFGDSGSPLLVQSPDGFKVAGITSWGYGCNSSRFYSVYTRVSSFSRWVHSFPPIPPSNKSSPVVIGKGRVGSTLSCEKGVWRGEKLSFSIQWVAVKTDGSSSRIHGAVTARYSVTEDDRGRSLACKVTATNASGAAEAVSDTVGPIGRKAGATRETNASDTAVRVSSVKCRRKYCDFRVKASSTQVSSVEGYAIITSTVKCYAGSSSPACERIKSRLIEAKHLSGITYSFRLKVPKKGSIEIWLWAIDVNGGLQHTAAHRKFTLPV